MAFGSGLDDQDEVMSEINMTPLVDVMLVLLIIFMLTVPVLTHAVKVDLPQAQSAANDIKPETVTLAVTADGTVYWDEDVVDAAALDARLAAAAARTPQPEVHIRGDRQVAYEHVMKAMAAAQRAGVKKLGFVTDPAGR
jgi:biopolymer transport protein ExbD